LTHKRQILKSASIITFATVVSRICGYLRDQRITLLLGTSATADSFILAFGIPNLVRRLVAEGALSASFIPVFTGYLRDRSPEETWNFAGRVFWTLSLVLAAVTVLGVVFSHQVIALLTLFGREPAHWEQAVYLNRIIFPYVFFIGLASLAMAILNSFGVFGLPATMPILSNFTIILFSVGLVYRPIMSWAPMGYRSPAVALSAGVLLGGALQLAVLLQGLARRGMHFRFGISLRDPGVRALGRLMIPAFFGMGIYQINFFVGRIFAASARLPQGSVTSLYVADRITELVVGTFAIAVSTAILPMMSRQAAERDYAGLKNTFGFSTRLVSFVTIPAAVGLFVLRAPIVKVLFQHGEFASQSTTLTSRALLYYALGLPGFAAVKLVVPLFYALRDTVTPVRVAAYAMVLNVLLNILFLAVFPRYLSNGSPALASGLSAYLNFSLLFALFRQRFGTVGTRAILRSIAKISICSVAMGLGCVTLRNCAHFDSFRRVVSQAGILAAIIALCVGAYLALAWLLRCEELFEASSLFRRGEVALTGTSNWVRG
jgi:putative peptidoglycan lipid II flippase